jgi:hypothetical protein
MYIVYVDKKTFWVYKNLPALRLADDQDIFPVGAKIFKLSGQVIECDTHGRIAAYDGHCPECDWREEKSR